MDIRTGKLYDTKQAALDAGVPESDIAELEGVMDPESPLKQLPTVKFSKHTFGSFKNLAESKK